MKALQSLPSEYKEIFSVNLQKDKKIAVLINILAIVIMAVLAVTMHYFVPVTTVFDMQKGMGNYIARFVCLMVL